MAAADPTDQEKDSKLLSLEKAQRGVQVALAVLSTAMLFTFFFTVVFIMNCVLMLALFFVMFSLDRRIKLLGGKGGFYIDVKF